MTAHQRAARHITLSGSDLTRLRTAVQQGDDPLGLADLASDMRHGFAPAVKAAFRRVDDGMAAPLAESVAKRLASCRTIGNPGGLMPIDPLTATILAEMGIDPLLCAWVGLVAGCVDLDDDENGRIAATIDGTSPASSQDNWTTCTLHRTMIWAPREITLTETLPHTVLSAVEGLPLAAVLSHPALDRHALTILSSEVDERGSTVVRTNHSPVPASTADLVAARRNALNDNQN